MAFNVWFFITRLIQKLVAGTFLDSELAIQLTVIFSEKNLEKVKNGQRMLITSLCHHVRNLVTSKRQITTYTLMQHYPMHAKIDTQKDTPE
jgi:hypothetical protein